MTVNVMPEVHPIALVWVMAASRADRAEYWLAAPVPFAHASLARSTA